MYPKMLGQKMELLLVWKEQLTSGGNSTISNWYAISGKMPIAKAKMAPAEPTILYRRALFSVRLSIYGWPCKKKQIKIILFDKTAILLGELKRRQTN